MVHALRKKICALAHAKEVFLRPNVRAHLLPKEVRCNEGLGAHFGKHYINCAMSDPTCTFPPWAFADLATAACAIAAMDSAVIPRDSQYFDWNHAWSAFAPLFALQPSQHSAMFLRVDYACVIDDGSQDGLCRRCDGEVVNSTSQ